MNNQNNNKTEGKIEDLMMMFQHRIMSELRSEAIKLNLTISQIEVLHYIDKHKNPIMRDIANHLHITPPSVTAIIESLVDKNLLKREFDKKDRRIVRIVGTAKAIKTFTFFKNKKLLIIRNIFSGLNKKDEMELVRILSLVNVCKKYEK